MCVVVPAGNVSYGTRIVEPFSPFYFKMLFWPFLSSVFLRVTVSLNPGPCSKVCVERSLPGDLTGHSRPLSVPVLLMETSQLCNYQEFIAVIGIYTVYIYFSLKGTCTW